MVAAATVSPVCFSTGTLSPVRALWSALPRPEMTTPSTGMAPPALTITVSPGCTCSTGTATSPFSVRMVAVLGLKSINARMASPVRPLARASRNFPSVIRVRIMAADSK